MATKIVTKNSSTASAVPTASDLVQGELAVNVADKRLFTENNAGAIVELGTNPSALTVTGEITANGGIALGDNDKATFGAGDDLQIYHDGEHSYVSDTGIGYLKLKGSNYVQIMDASNAVMANFESGGAVYLSHNGADRFSTTATGIDVTGTATMDGLISSNVSGTTLIQAVGVDSNGFADVEIKSIGTSGASRLYFSDTAAKSGSIKYTHSSDAMLFSTAGAARLNIASNGDISFYEDTGTTAKLFWDASAESLGIGTSSPEFPVTAYAATGQPYIGSITTNVKTVLASDETNLRAYIGTRTNHPISFVTDGDERVRIDSAGFVGIGVVPTEQLHVGGRVHAVLELQSSTTTGTGRVNFNDGSNAGQILYSHVTNTMDFYAGGSYAMRLTNTGITAPQGIYLGGTGAANKLDDYEEGSWTPTIGASTDPTMTYNTQSAVYTKVGNLVSVTCKVITATRSGGSGQLTVDGLPFTVAANVDSPIYIGFNYNWTTPPNGGSCQQGTNHVLLYSSIENNIASVPVDILASGNSYLIFSATYRTNS